MFVACDATLFTFRTALPSVKSGFTSSVFPKISFQFLDIIDFSVKTPACRSPSENEACSLLCGFIVKAIIVYAL
ncbi:MAG: hypothetical protein C4576_34670 [Desulfobacteraceae bacterium]|nr:MAG: hypothetical protein C4576_34670 [Desulfobacteraceae bacterium]